MTSSQFVMLDDINFSNIFYYIQKSKSDNDEVLFKQCTDFAWEYSLSLFKSQEFLKLNYNELQSILLLLRQVFVNNPVMKKVLNESEVRWWEQNGQSNHSHSRSVQSRQNISTNSSSSILSSINPFNSKSSNKSQNNDVFKVFQDRIEKRITDQQNTIQQQSEAFKELKNEMLNYQRVALKKQEESKTSIDNLRNDKTQIENELATQKENNQRLTQEREVDKQRYNSKFQEQENTIQKLKFDQEESQRKFSEQNLEIKHLNREITDLKDLIKFSDKERYKHNRQNQQELSALKEEIRKLATQQESNTKLANRHQLAQCRIDDELNNQREINHKLREEKEINKNKISEQHYEQRRITRELNDQKEFLQQAAAQQRQAEIKFERELNNQKVFNGFVGMELQNNRQKMNSQYIRGEEEFNDVTYEPEKKSTVEIQELND